MYYDDDPPYRDSEEQEENFHTDTSEITAWDEAKIEDLEMGDNMKGEAGHFTVARGAGSYAVNCERGEKKGHFFKSTAKEVIDFLRDN